MITGMEFVQNHARFMRDWKGKYGDVNALVVLRQTADHSPCSSCLEILGISESPLAGNVFYFRISII